HRRGAGRCLAGAGRAGGSGAAGVCAGAAVDALALVRADGAVQRRFRHRRAGGGILQFHLPGADADAGHQQVLAVAGAAAVRARWPGARAVQPGYQPGAPAAREGGLMVAGIFALLLAVGVPVAFVLAISALVYIFATGNTVLLDSYPQQFFGGLENYGLLALPLFILVGECMNEGGIARRL